jgi:hypothetical protein
LPEKRDSFDNDSKFAAHEIRKAMKSIQPILGNVPLGALIQEFRHLGLDLEDERNSYSLSEIQSALESTFDEASILLTDQIRLALQEGRRQD